MKPRIGQRFGVEEAEQILEKPRASMGCPCTSLVG